MSVEFGCLQHALGHGTVLGWKEAPGIDPKSMLEGVVIGMLPTGSCNQGEE